MFVIQYDDTAIEGTKRVQLSIEVEDGGGTLVLIQDLRSVRPSVPIPMSLDRLLRGAALEMNVVVTTKSVIKWVFM